MVSNQNILSFIFFIASAIYTTIGFYSFSLNKKKPVNKLFFIICLCLAEWAICFTLSTGTDHINFKKALLFRKLGVFGWGIFYSLGYHFLLVLKAPNKKHPIYEYLLIYIPSLINIILYTCLGETSNAQFAMIYTKNGWISDNVASPINAYFHTYVFVFSTLTIVRALYWQFRSNDSKTTKESHILTILYLISFFLSLLIEIILNKLLNYNIIQPTILFLLAPVSIMFYILLKKKVIIPSVDSNTYQIIDQHKQENIFNMTGAIYLLFAYTSLFFNYIIGPQHRMYNQILYSVIFYLVGFSHFFLKRILNRIKGQYAFITITSIVFMFIVSIRYQLEGFNAIWGIIFYYLLITAVFENRKYTYIIVIGGILIQFFTWYKNPLEYNLLIDWTEYYKRIIMILLSLLVVLYINKLYKTKIKENLAQIKIQEILSKISTQLLEVTINNLDDKILDVLSLCSEGFNYSAGYYFKWYADKSYFELICHTEPEADKEAEFVLNNSRCRESILKGQRCPVLDISEEINVSERAKNYFERKKIVGFYAFPIMIDDIVQGCIIFDFKKKRKYTAICNFNKTIANIIGNTIKKINYEKILYYNAHYDILTGLKNSNGFTQEVKKILKTEKLIMPATIFLDINNFKVINNAFGHSVGDRMLKSVANMIKDNSEENTVIARFNKDEFCLFYPDTKKHDEILERVKKIINLFESPIHILDYEFKIYLNIGIAVYPEDGGDIETLIKNADLALNESKRRGKKKIHFCNEGDKNKTLQNIVYTNKLFSALQNNELKLAYQPQIDCQTGKVIGAEALVRWVSPEFGTISPAKFIPILEHTGLIVKVGEWIVEQVAIQQAKMIAKGLPKIRLSANLSVVQFQDEYLIQKLKNIIDNWVVDTDYFELEITENVATSHDTFLFERFKEIKTLGCSIAIDDFGVEFSSLNRLQSLPIDRLKIDKSFVDGIGIDEKKESIVKIVIQLAKALELDSIAEGVENEEQVKFLKNLNCREIQGYYFAKPMFDDEFEEFVRNNS